MRLAVAVGIVAMVAIGCGDAVSLPDAGADTGGDDVTTPPDVGTDTGRYMCGQAPGKAYVAHFTRTAGACAASVDLEITIGDLNDFCDAVGQVRTDVFGAGLCDVACYGNTQSCVFHTAVACNGCQGSYDVRFAAK